MKLTNFSKGIISTSAGSFFWGFLGTIYFQYISFIGVFEVVVHRSIWTCIILLITTTLFKKWNLFKKVLFIDCKSDVLIRRFGETRRRHPLAADQPIADSLKLERDRLAPLRQSANMIIDTSEMHARALKQLLQERPVTLRSTEHRNSKKPSVRNLRRKMVSITLSTR